MRRERKAPSLAASFRDRKEEARADYNAARYSQFRRVRTGIAPMGSGSDWHYRMQVDWLKILEQSRDMDRNDAIVHRLLDVATLNTVQDGFGLDVNTGDPKLDLELKARWDEWSNDPYLCDAQAELTWNQMESIIFRQMLLDGDHFALPLESGELQLIEAHRVRNPGRTTRNMVHGVELTQRRRRKAYWVTKDDLNPYTAAPKISDMVSYAPRDEEGNLQFFHVYNPRRTTQTRGIGILAPIFDQCGQAEDIGYATLIRQQVASCYAVIRNRQLGWQGPGAQQTGPEWDQQGHLVEELSPGMEYASDPGETIGGFSPNIPSPQFFPHMKHVLTLISVNAGVPLILLLMDASETNFSGWRGAVDQARLGFGYGQQQYITRLHVPVWNWKVRQWGADDPAIARAALKRKVNVFNHVWNPRGWPYIEPLKDTQTDLLRVRNGLISQRRRCNERGLDWPTLRHEICEDNAGAIKEAMQYARDLNKGLEDPSERVHWREVLSLPTPDGLAITAKVMEQAAEDDADKQPAPAAAGGNGGKN
ncbi:MAG TPA: phage portal protein [Planctomycetaceae bacterium]|jgi:lambda family phage portal protein|nr:phage portal protein [Planctomycetaceae bacterium]